ncbi:MAG: DUF1559 domain-containing protein [Planctomycetia bacterium]|nr:DUF1559 domain-containing protein [Planctomycetia bacterium]
MNPEENRFQFSLLQLLVVALIIAILSGAAILYAQRSREQARRASCAVKMKQLAISLHLFHDNQQTFPASAFYHDGQDLGRHNVNVKTVVPGQGGTAATRAPYSFWVRVLPYFGSGQVYDSINFVRDEAFDKHNAPLAATVYPVFICPSFPSGDQSRARDYDAFSRGGPRPALTQYKALGATTLTVLQNSAFATAKNGDGGVLHPYARYTFNDIGAPASTAWLCETREERYAAWWDGTTISIPGFDPQIDSTGQATTPAYGAAIWARPAGQKPVFIPAVMFGGAEDMQWGPSSFHPGLINHAMVDTEVRAIALDIDPKVYASLITRRSDDDAPASGP